MLVFVIFLLLYCIVSLSNAALYSNPWSYSPWCANLGNFSSTYAAPINPYYYGYNPYANLVANWNNDDFAQRILRAGQNIQNGNYGWRNGMWLPINQIVKDYYGNNRDTTYGSNVYRNAYGNGSYRDVYRTPEYRRAASDFDLRYLQRNNVPGLPRF
ncbi:hypothetical protein DdX_17172 [Ditylenchus destructor]|uniref:Uncharacterized protein n=1 Tax=Ditylenchus destructor TaxID=166010 RepID=A0AAD4QZE0_9BILA|nr:hypothetical protein DdX_17172 [Ditylenchus destructor]